MKKLSLLVLVGMMAILSGTGCGKLSDAQQQDVANIVGGVGTSGDKQSGMLAEPVSGKDVPHGLVELINQQINGALWLVKFKKDAGELDSLSPWSSCPASPGGGCTISCPSSSSLKVACTGSGSSSETCSGTTYTFSSQTVALTIDVSGITSSGGGNTGTFGMTLAFGADVNGGALDGKNLSCTIGLSFDIAKIDAGTPQTPSLDCSNFSCSYDGKNLDCSKVQADFGSSMACTSS